MKSELRLVSAVVGAVLGVTGQYVDVPVVTFDGAPGTTFKWENLNDSMMGGSSNVSFVTAGKGSAVLEGTIDSLPTPAGAPGFVSVQTATSKLPQMNGCQGISITSRARTNYTGFRLSFGTDTYYSRQGYKAAFHAPVSEAFAVTNVSFYDFTRAWDDATGLPEIECSKEIGVCPTFLTLNNAQRVEVWAQGVLGRFHIEIQSINAYGCAPSDLHSRQVLV